MYGEQIQLYVIFIQVGPVSCEITAHVPTNWNAQARLVAKAAGELVEFLSIQEEQEG